MTDTDPILSSDDGRITPRNIEREMRESYLTYALSVIHSRALPDARADPEAARNHIQARCVGLARLGCVVLQYDMLGYCDNDQISYQLAHRFAKQRPDMISAKRWGLPSFGSPMISVGSPASPTG